MVKAKCGRLVSHAGREVAIMVPPGPIGWLSRTDVYMFEVRAKAPRPAWDRCPIFREPSPSREPLRTG